MYELENTISNNIKKHPMYQSWKSKEKIVIESPYLPFLREKMDNLISADIENNEYRIYNIKNDLFFNN